MAMPLIHVYLVYMHLYIAQQSIIFTENVEKTSLFFSEPSLHKLFNINVVILYKMYGIPRISVWQASSTQLENPSMACACKVKNFAKAVCARKVRPDVIVPHSKVSQTVDIFVVVCQTVMYSLYLSNPDWHCK